MDKRAHVELKSERVQAPAVYPSASATRAALNSASLRSVYQGLSLGPISAEIELFCPPYNPNQLMNVSGSCSS